MSEIKLLATSAATGNTFRVTFAGDGADAAAAEYLQARTALDFDFAEDDESTYLTAPLVFAVLAPSCEHGLSEWLCAGPGHYPAGM